MSIPGTEEKSRSKYAANKSESNDKYLNEESIAKGQKASQNQQQFKLDPSSHSEPSTANWQLFVSNLPFSMKNEDLHKLFTEYGEVKSADVMLDQQSGRSRGFGFVEMADEADARLAVDSLNGMKHEGRVLKGEASTGGSCTYVF